MRDGSFPRLDGVRQSRLSAVKAAPICRVFAGATAWPSAGFAVRLVPDLLKLAGAVSLDTFAVEKDAIAADVALDVVRRSA